MTSIFGLPRLEASAATPLFQRLRKWMPFFQYELDPAFSPWKVRHVAWTSRIRACYWWRCGPSSLAALRFQ